MRFAKRLLMVAGAVALSGIASVMVAPKAVHAIVSTLVTVANTSSNPVSVSQGADLANEPFVTSICNNGSSPATCSELATALGSSATPPASFTVPTSDSEGHLVKALVIQFVSGTCAAAASPILTTTVPANAVNGISNTANFLSLVTQTSGASLVDQPTTIVAGPGSTVGLFGALLSSTPSCALTLNGYLAH